MGFQDYLFSIPTDPQYETWLILIAVACSALAITASVIAGRTGYASVRLRARELCFIMVGLALTLIVHLVARSAEIDAISWRVWPILLGAFFLIRLIWWLIGLRSAKHDKVDELNRHRKQLYQTSSRRPRGKPAKRRRRK